MPQTKSGWQQQWSVIQPRYAGFVTDALAETLTTLWATLPHSSRNHIDTPTTKAAWADFLAQGNLPPTIVNTLRDTLETELPNDVLAELNAVQVDRHAVSCHQCGVCCRLTSSEHDYDTLLAMAATGDDFAEQFTRVMLPYDTVDTAKNRFPELVDHVLTSAADPTAVHFYHCPYVTEDHKCGLWGDPKRPALCATYPETPLVWLQPNCAWSDWQGEHLDTVLRCHARLAVYESLLAVFPA